MDRPMGGENPRRCKNRERTLVALGAGATWMGGDKDKELSNDSERRLSVEHSENESLRSRLICALLIFLGAGYCLRLPPSPITRLGEIFVLATMIEIII